MFSGRKLEEATYDSVAFRYITGDDQPDHDTIANFRKRFLGELEGLFKQVLEMAAELGTVRLGRVSLDGTKMQGNASKHKAMSWRYANKLEQQLAGEVQTLLKRAEQADQEAEAEQQELDIPEELQRREERLAAIREAKEKIEERAQERHAVERAEYEEKLKRRQERAGAPERAPETPCRVLLASRCLPKNLNPSREACFAHPTERNQALPSQAAAYGVPWARSLRNPATMTPTGS